MEILNHEWRWKHLYFIRTEEGIVKIRPRADQQQILDLLYPAFFAKQQKKVVILKNRQRGTSTLCSLFCEDCTAYYPGKVANTLADTRERAASIFDNVAKFAWDRIPPGLRPKADKDNVTALDFSEDIGSKYIISATKSEPADILHISEAPYFPDEGKITEAMQMVRKTGITIMESTAYGIGNLFEKTFMNAWKAKKEGKYHHWDALFFPWYTDPTNRVRVHPDMVLQNRAFIEELAQKYHLTPEQMFFYDQQMSDLEEEVFQFYPSEPEEAFLHSGRPVFNQEILAKLKAKHERAPNRVTDDDIAIWEEPDDSKRYGIGVDTAEGKKKGDNSIISVICDETGEEVAQYAGKPSIIDESGLARLIGIVCRMYKTHCCVIERNNHGHAVIAHAKNEPGVTLYRQQARDQITEAESEVIGWDTSEKSKAFAMSELKKGFREGTCIPHGVDTFDELRTYVHGERGKMDALPGHHDDRVVALALANVARSELTFGELLIA